MMTVTTTTTSASQGCQPRLNLAVSLLSLPGTRSTHTNNRKMPQHVGLCSLAGPRTAESSQGSGSLPLGKPQGARVEDSHRTAAYLPVTKPSKAVFLFYFVFAARQLQSYHQRS